MAVRAFSLTATVRAGPEEVVDFLADLPRHVGLHPFLVSADVVASGDDASGAWRDYTVTERPAFWRWHYRLRFPVRVVRTSPTSLRSGVRALRGCRLTAVTRAVAGADGTTVVTETTTVTAPRRLVGYMARNARLAHARTFSVLDTHLAGG